MDPEMDSGGSAISETKLSFCVIEDLEVTGDAFADVTGVTAELPFVLAFAIAFLVASFTSWNFSINFPSSPSLAKPKPYTVFARTSLHCPNFCDVCVNVMLGVIVELITA